MSKRVTSIGENMELDELERQFGKLLRRWSAMIMIAEEVKESLDDLARIISELKRGDKHANNTRHNSKSR